MTGTPASRAAALVAADRQHLPAEDGARSAQAASATITAMRMTCTGMPSDAAEADELELRFV